MTQQTTTQVTPQVSPVIVRERVQELARANGAKWDVLMAIKIDAKTDPVWLVTRLTQILPAQADKVAKIWNA